MLPAMMIVSGLISAEILAPPWSNSRGVHARPPTIDRRWAIRRKHRARVRLQRNGGLRFLVQREETLVLSRPTPPPPLPPRGRKREPATRESSGATPHP